MKNDLKKKEQQQQQQQQQQHTHTHTTEPHFLLLYGLILPPDTQTCVRVRIWGQVLVFWNSHYYITLFSGY